MKDRVASRATRGIVYGGVFYDISFRMNGRPPVPVLYLEPIGSAYIKNVFLLSKEQQHWYERTIAEALRCKRLEDKISMPITLVLSEKSPNIVEDKGRTRKKN